jgi:hypothetical protein
MKRQVVILSVCGGIFLLLCCGVGFFLVSALHENGTIKEDRDQKFSEMKGIYGSEMFPSATNIAQVKADAKVVESWLGTASNLFAKGQLKVDAAGSPTAFKAQLLSVVQELRKQPGGNNGKAVAADFGFGFSSYLGAMMPDKNDVPRLSLQLAIINSICKELYAANVVEITSVTREEFDVKKAGEEGAEDNQPRRRGGIPRRSNNSEAGRKPAAGAGASAAPQVAIAPFTMKQTFTVEFRARPAELLASLNRLAAMDLFTVVTDVTVTKPHDMLKEYNQKRAQDQANDAKKDNDPKAADLKAVDPATLPLSKRIVTDPELDPPGSVKLVLDVYTL